MLVSVLRGLLDVGCELALDVSCHSIVAHSVGDRLQLGVVEDELTLLVLEVGVGALSLVAAELGGSFPDDLSKVAVNGCRWIVILLLINPELDYCLTALCRDRCTGCSRCQILTQADSAYRLPMVPAATLCPCLCVASQLVVPDEILRATNASSSIVSIENIYGELVRRCVTSGSRGCWSGRGRGA